MIQFSERRPYSVDGSLALDVRPSYYPLPGQESNVIFLERQQKSLLQEQIDYFGQNYRREELPRDWWNINDIGFSMKSQMRLLAETGDVNQVERDLRGFALEYLRQGTVFPFEYEIVDGELVDRKYGNRRLLDTVDPNERGGAVKESLSKIQEYLVGGEDGEMAIMVSPPGWTGLAMDNGEKIVYEDTQTFYLQKVGDRVLGAGLRTDFDLNQVKQLIKQLTGQELPASASVIDCVKVISTINPNTDGVGSASDLVRILQKVKKESRPGEASFAYQDKTWEDMERDISRRQELYEFDERTGEIINDFREYVLSGNRTQLEIQKALAATFLILSRYFLVDKKIQYGEIHTETYARDIAAMRVMTYGQVVEEVQKLPGCAGGGSSATSVTSITERSAKKWDGETYDEDGPCRLCGKDVVCGPCKVCQVCTEADNAKRLAA